MSIASPDQTAWAWFAGAGLAAIVALAILATIIVRSVVTKARAEDLPEVLTGLSQVLEATAGFLPWRAWRNDLDIPPAAQAHILSEADLPLSSVKSTAKDGAADIPLPEQLPPMSGPSGGAQ